MWRGSGVGGRFGGAGSAGKIGVCEVRLKSKPASSEVAGVAILNGGDSAHICAPQLVSFGSLERSNAHCHFASQNGSRVPVTS